MSIGRTLARAAIAGIGFTCGAMFTAYALAEYGYRAMKRQTDEVLAEQRTLSESIKRAEDKRKAE